MGQTNISFIKVGHLYSWNFLQCSETSVRLEILIIWSCYS